MISDVGENGFVPEQLTLEAPGVDSRAVARAQTRATYEHPLKWYADRFGMKAGDAVRTLKRWVARGREVDPPDLPPFDRPWELAAWWRRHMKWSVPDWIEMLETLGEQQAGLVAEVARPVAPAASVDDAKGEAVAGRGPEAEGPMELPPEFDLDDLPRDADDAERVLRGFANGFRNEMKAAQLAGNTAKFWSSYKEFIKVIKELRNWERDRHTKRVVAGKAMDVATMSEVLTAMFGTLAKSYHQGLQRLVKMVDPQRPDAEVRALAFQVRDEVFRGLKAGRFLEVVMGVIEGEKHD